MRFDYCLPLALILAAGATPALAQQAPAGTAAAPAAPTATDAAATATVGQAIASSATHSTFEKLLAATNQQATLAASGPYTVFAPSDDAFARLAPGTLDTLEKPENAPSLAAIVKYHIVPGAITLDDLKKQIDAGGGSTTLTTLAGQALTAKNVSGAIELVDPSGNVSYVAKPSDKEANGVLQYVNGVLIPDLQKVVDEQQKQMQMQADAAAAAQGS